MENSPNKRFLIPRENLAYTLEWKYDDHGNLVSETNALGDKIIRRYDEQWTISSSSKVPRQIFILKITMTFLIDSLDQKEVHADQSVFTTQYCYNHLGQCEKNINSYGLATAQKFDDFGPVTEITYPTLLNEKGEPVSPITKSVYDIAGYPITVVDAKGQKTKLTYNIRGQPTKIEYPDGTSEHMTYRLDGQLMEKIEKNGTRTVYQRDPLGRITEEAQYKGNVELRKTQHEYNAFHLLKTIDAEGGVTRYTYDKAGRLKKTCHGEQIQENDYDTLGKVSEIKEYYGSQHFRLTKRRYDF